MSDTTYILVHGAWSAAWVWRDVGAELTRREVKWSALDLPSSTHGAHPNTYLADDAREVIEVAKLDGPVVLVGHSYGGAVITEAAEQIPNLEAMIYVAALIPELGHSTTGVSRMVDAPTMLDAAIESDGDMLRLKPTLAKEALFQDCSDEVADWAVSQLTPQTTASLRSPRSAFDVDVPTYYMRCTLDQAVDPGLQELLASHCDEVAVLESGHTPMLSQPEYFCDLLLMTVSLEEE
jgi:pimeloyl-ACP methyl ester carboxylesterase